jgi:transposase
MIRLTDDQWERIRDHFPEENIADGRPGRKPIPTRCVLEAVLWILNTGAQWHMLPQSYPNYKTVPPLRPLPQISQRQLPRQGIKRAPREASTAQLLMHARSAERASCLPVGVGASEGWLNDLIVVSHASHYGLVTLVREIDGSPTCRTFQLFIFY